MRVVEIVPGVYISIHAPHAGRDLVVRPVIVRAVNISIHAPHAGRDGLERIA